MNYTYGLNLSVIGVCIGLPKYKMVGYLEEMESKEFGRISSYNLIDPLELGRFGKKKSFISEFIGQMRGENIYLEPIYSGKSVYTILHERILQENKEGVFYLHQGGLLSKLTHVK